MSELQSAELDQRRAERIAREREMLAIAEAEIARGECYDLEVVEAWLDERAKLPLPPWCSDRNAAEMLKVGIGQLDWGEHYEWDVVKARMKQLETDPDAKLPPRSDAGISRCLR